MVGAAPVGEALAKKFLEKAPHIELREGIDLSQNLAIILSIICT